MLSGLVNVITVFSIDEFCVGVIVDCNGSGGKLLESENDDGYIIGCVGWDEEIGSAVYVVDVCCGAKLVVDLGLLCFSGVGIGAGIKVFG